MSTVIHNSMRFGRALSVTARKCFRDINPVEKKFNSIIASLKQQQPTDYMHYNFLQKQTKYGEGVTKTEEFLLGYAHLQKYSDVALASVCLKFINQHATLGSVLANAYNESNEWVVSNKMLVGRTQENALYNQSLLRLYSVVQKQKANSDLLRLSVQDDGVHCVSWVSSNHTIGKFLDTHQPYTPIINKIKTAFNNITLSTGTTKADHDTGQEYQEFLLFNKIAPETIIVRAYGFENLKSHNIQLNTIANITYENIETGAYLNIAVPLYHIDWTKEGVGIHDSNIQVIGSHSIEDAPGKPYKGGSSDWWMD